VIIWVRIPHPRCRRFCGDDGLLMTLLVAAVDGKNIWMVADAAITGAGADVRNREYHIKIIPSRDGRGLVGFAGDVHHGARLVEQAALMPAGKEAVSFLHQSQRENHSIDFAYGYVDETGPHLIRVSEGEVQELGTFHLGVTDAFEHFQRIRHDAEIDHVPEAVKTFMISSRATEGLPERLSEAVTGMLRLFAERSERDVGGWPTAYFLTSEGAFLCGYAYSVSDPILKQIGPGSIVPHGTPEAGGFGLSVTEVGQGRGIVVYWLQQPGGSIFLRADGGYDLHQFAGTPSAFKEKVLAETGENIDLWFGEQPHGVPEHVTIMRDKNGAPNMVIARQGNSLSFSIVNVGTPFRSRAKLNMSPESQKAVALLASDHLSVTLSDDKKAATLNLVTDGNPVTKIELTASEFDSVLAVLGEARASMQEQVPYKQQQNASTRDVMILNPTWRTESEIHPSLAGITLRLRHTGFGWLSFLLPHSEAHALGTWLVKHARTQPVGAAAPPVNAAPPSSGQEKKTESEEDLSC
jgi:hypothetical protein